MKNEDTTVKDTTDGRVTISRSLRTSRQRRRHDIDIGTAGRSNRPLDKTDEHYRRYEIGNRANAAPMDTIAAVDPAKNNLSFLSDAEKKTLSSIPNATIRAYAEDAINRLNWRYANIVFVTLTTLPGWRTKDLTHTVDLLLEKTKNVICGKSRALLEAVRIKGLLAHETKTRFGDKTDAHVHMLLTIEGVDFPPIMEMVLWELLNQDARFDRKEIIERNLTNEQKEIADDWINWTHTAPQHEIAVPVTFYTFGGDETRHVLLKRRTAAYGRKLNAQMETRPAGNVESLIGRIGTDGLIDYCSKALKRDNYYYDHLGIENFVTPIEV